LLSAPDLSHDELARLGIGEEENGYPIAWLDIETGDSETGMRINPFFNIFFKRRPGISPGCNKWIEDDIVQLRQPPPPLPTAGEDTTAENIDKQHHVVPSYRKMQLASPPIHRMRAHHLWQDDLGAEEFVDGNLGDLLDSTWSYMRTRYKSFEEYQDDNGHYFAGLQAISGFEKCGSCGEERVDCVC
jgi:hypothetical protein